MKRILALVVIFILIIGTVYAEEIESIIPDTSIWGMSRKEFSETHDYEFQTMEIAEAKVLHQSEVMIDDRSMDVYYVFDFPTWDSTGYSYRGLNKIVYLLSDANGQDKTDLEEVRQSFVDAMQSSIGAPDSVSKAVTTWNKGTYKVDIGRGKFEKYNGSKDKNVAIIVTGVDIVKPVTPPPTPKPTPKYKYISPTPRPTKNSKKKEPDGYYLDKSQMVFHSKANCIWRDLYYGADYGIHYGSRQYFINQGYSPCSACCD